jgi:hypothetical protein
MMPHSPPDTEYPWRRDRVPEGRTPPYQMLLESLGATPEERKANFGLIARLLEAAERNALPVTEKTDHNARAQGLAYIAAHNLQELRKMEPLLLASLSTTRKPS